MLVVVSDHSRARANAVTVNRYTAPVERELAVRADNAVIRRPTRTGLALRRTSSASRPVAEAAVRTHRPRRGRLFRRIALRSIRRILSEARLARNADSATVLALIATQLTC